MQNFSAPNIAHYFHFKLEQSWEQGNIPERNLYQLKKIQNNFGRRSSNFGIAERTAFFPLFPVYSVLVYFLSLLVKTNQESQIKLSGIFITKKIIDTKKVVSKKWRLKYFKNMSATASSSTSDGSRYHSVELGGDAQENVAPRQVSLGISGPAKLDQLLFFKSG